MKNKLKHMDRILYTHSSGTSLIELLIYTGILVLIVSAVGSTTLALSRIYRTIVAEQTVEEAGHVALERILRETRDAVSINAGSSDFATTTGRLTLNAIDENEDAIELQFYLSGQTLRLREDAADLGPLVSGDARVTRFYLTSITTTLSQAVKVEMTVESGTSTSYRSKNFYGTAVVRGSYLDQ